MGKSLKFTQLYGRIRNKNNKFNLIVRMIIDSACIVWGQTCGEQGNCWLYDSHKLSLLLNTISSGEY